MADILIKGMEMPDYGYVCLKVFANGEVLMTKVKRGSLVITGINDKIGTAIPVPPHGDLIERDALTISTAVPLDGKPYQYVHIDNIKVAPTIIPADPAEEGEV